MLKKEEKKEMNEKQMILTMLSEGKITVEESIKLIKACDSSSTFDEIIEKTKIIYSNTMEKLEPVGEEVLRGAKEVYKSAEPIIDETLENVREAYKKAEPKIKEAAHKTKEAASKAIENVKKNVNNR